MTRETFALGMTGEGRFTLGMTLEKKKRIVAARSLIPLVEGSGCKSRAAPATVTGDAPGEKPLDA